MSVQKLAVLGGGLGALSAVFEITEEANWQRKYEITVYQVGWRLGGKGASGRDKNRHDAIQEHGLHLFPGFYDNTFDLVKRCYAALKRHQTQPIPTWRDAFVALNHVFVAENIGGRTLRWRLDFPPNPLTPGTGDAWELTPKAYTLQLLKFLATQFSLDISDPDGDGILNPEVGPRDAAFHFAKLLDQAIGLFRAAIEGATSSTRGGEDGLNRHPAPANRLGGVTRIIDQIIRRLQALHAAVGADEHDRRRQLVVAELAAVLVRGMIVDRIVSDGFDKLDEEEWSDWLRRHGASRQVVDSGIVRACYDFCFGYEGGDPRRRSVAAGAGSRMLMRMLLTYKGALFYKLRGSMGDTIFAPLYEVLSGRGVKFRFFHRVRALRVDAAGRGIDAIDLDRQVDLLDPSREYYPLIDVNGLPSWRSRPDKQQIVDGERIDERKVNFEDHWSDWPKAASRTLARGIDFDRVILGISLGAFQEICADLINRSTRWANMVKRIATVATQAMQVWLRADPEALGWREGGTSTTALPKPFDTAADMTHVVALETWPEEDQPRTIAYFCAALPDTDPRHPAPDPAFADAEDSRVAANWRQWQSRTLRHIWPRFDDSQIMHRYWRSNINPSDRYVQTVPGSTKYRLPAEGSGFDNLVLAGDWVRTGINGGCAEGATMAGLAAARAITGRKIMISGETDSPETPVSRSPFGPARSGPVQLLGHATGELQAAGVTLTVPRRVVAGMLPAGLRPAPQGITPSGLHPIGLLFARHHRVRPSIVPFGGLGYRELAIIIPFVEHIAADRPPGPMIHMPRLYLDEVLPMLLGLLYAYEKRVARLNYDGLSFTVRSLAGPRLMSADFRQAGPPGKISQQPSWSVTRQMIEMPTVSVDGFGGFHYTYMEMNLDSALSTPLSVRLTIDQSPVLGFPLGQVSFDSIMVGPTGGFYLETRWSLTNLLQSSAIASQMRRINR